MIFFFFSSRRRHTRCSRDLEFRRVLFRSPGVGAAVGAGGGLLAGTAVGAGAGETAAHQVQQRYNNAYEQCMYAKGNQIPAAALPSPRGTSFAAPPPPPPLPPTPVPGVVSPPASMGR